jgi:hypothetical protein
MPNASLRVPPVAESPSQPRSNATRGLTARRGPGPLIGRFASMARPTTLDHFVTRPGVRLLFVRRRPCRDAARSESSGAKRDARRLLIAWLLIAGLPSPVWAQHPPAAQRAPKPSATAPLKPPASSPAKPPEATSEAGGTEGGKPVHALEGVWKVYWIDQNKASEMRIGQVATAPNITSLVGSMATLDAEACPMTGSVIDALNGSYQDGLETKSHQISAYVVLRAQCPNRQIWIEGFGLPAGRVLISGRATIIDAAGKRSYSAVGLGR